MPRADLKVWATTTYIEPIYNTPNKLTIPDELYDKGWLINNPVAGQHINQVLYDITYTLKNETLDPSANLTDLTNNTAARAALDVFQKSANLSDIPDAGLARVALNTFTMAANLSDVVDKGAARTNLDLNQKSLNLSDVPNKSTARSNLDLYQRSLNLSDIPSASIARDNLGLNIDSLFDTFFDKVYPVGSVYENKTNSANPNTYLGRGTWVAEGQGRVAIGAGSGTDSRGETLSFTAGATGGEYKHVMLQAELVPHVHTTNWPMYTEAGSEENHIASGGTNLETEKVTLSTESIGTGNPFNITQPYSVYFRWVRTS